MGYRCFTPSLQLRLYHGEAARPINWCQVKGTACPRRELSPGQSTFLVVSQMLTVAPPYHTLLFRIKLGWWLMSSVVEIESDWHVIIYIWPPWKIMLTRVVGIKPWLLSKGQVFRGKRFTFDTKLRNLPFATDNLHCIYGKHTQTHTHTHLYTVRAWYLKRKKQTLYVCNLQVLYFC